MDRPLSIRSPKFEDAKAVCDLVIACDIEDFGAPDFDLGELLEMWEGFDLQHNVWIIEDETAQIVGYAFLEEDSEEKIFSYGFVLPAKRGFGVGAKLLTAIEHRAYELSLSSGIKKRLQNLIPTGSEDAQQLLQSRGFKPVRYFKRMSITMEDAPVKPKVPSGMTIKPFIKGQDEQEVYNVYIESFADHWDFAAPPFEKWVEKTQRESFTPGWWFVARSETGDVAGFAFCRMNEDCLFVNQLGVKAAYRGTGLGFALLQHTFFSAYSLGQRTVSLGVDSANPTGAHRLYERAGMKAVHDVTLCEKIVG